MANKFTADPNCVALWRMEAGALTVDSIGTNTLTNVGVAEDVANFKEGACAADFESADTDYLYRTDANLSAGFPLKSTDATKTYTFCCWVKFESLGDMALFSKAGAISGMKLVINAGGVLSLNQIWSTLWNIDTLVAGRWYHIAVSGNAVANTVTVRIWDDTAGIATTYTHTFSSAYWDDSERFTIGAYGAANPLDGLIDEFVVFNDELTVADIDLIRTGDYGNPRLAGTIAAVSSVQGNITGVSTLLEGTAPAVASVSGYLTGGAVALGTANCNAVSGAAGALTLVLGVLTAIPASTGGWVWAGAGVVATTTPDLPVGWVGGWAMGGEGVWASSTPTDTEIPAAAEPTGFYFGGGAAAGEAEVVSTIPAADEIAAEAPFIFCGPGATGNAATTFPASDVIVAVAEFVFGGAGVITQVAAADLPSAALIGSGGWILSGTGFALDPAVTPTTTIIISTGGWRLGGRRPDPIEVTYPDSVDRVIISSGGWEFCGHECVWEESVPSSTIIETSGAVFLVGGSGLCTSRMPLSTVIIAEGGWILAGADSAEIFETWVLNSQSFEPSIFSGFNFNSFASRGGVSYAAGASGIYVLGGDYDDGESIQSGCRVGPCNFGHDREKRIRGVQFGQAGPQTKVRVRTETGEGVFSTDRDGNRVTISRDLQGAEFTLDFLDFDELSHCEIYPLLLARR